MTKKAVLLLSGGLDSATTLALAREQGFEVYCLSFRYGQRHAVELMAASRVADALGAAEHKIADIDLRLFGGSALTADINVPKSRTSDEMSHGIPITYVPARNTIFLSFALAWAEVLKAYDIFIGVNALDYSGYPDCRPEFIEAFERTANLATAYGVASGDAAGAVVPPPTGGRLGGGLKRAPALRFLSLLRERLGEGSQHKLKRCSMLHQPSSNLPASAEAPAWRVWHTGKPKPWRRLLPKEGEGFPPVPVSPPHPTLPPLGGGLSRIRIHTPIIRLTKAEIIREGLRLGVDYAMTISCYDPAPDGTPCRQCDSCQLRAKGFSENGLVGV